MMYSVTCIAVFVSVKNKCSCEKEESAFYSR